MLLPHMLTSFRMSQTQTARYKMVTRPCPGSFGVSIFKWTGPILIWKVLFFKHFLFHVRMLCSACLLDRTNNYLKSAFFFKNTFYSMSECCVVLVCLGCPLTTCKAWSDIVLLFVLWRQLPQTPEQTKESCFLKDSGLKTRSVAVPFSLFSF